jgi:hypothetical protein
MFIYLIVKVLTITIKCTTIFIDYYMTFCHIGPSIIDPEIFHVRLKAL